MLWFLERVINGNCSEQRREPQSNITSARHSIILGKSVDWSAIWDRYDFTIVSTGIMAIMALIVVRVSAKSLKKIHQAEKIDFSDNLTTQAKNGNFKNIFVNKGLLEKMMVGLSQKEAANILLVGSPGTGKSVTVRALAVELLSKRCLHPSLTDVEIISLTASDFTSGCSLRGQAEERMKQFLESVSQYKKVIVFIDEFHTMCGTKNYLDPNSNLMNQLKPAMADGRIRIIGATTEEESAVVLQDSAVQRRFTVLKLTEPNNLNLMQILTLKKEELEDYHQCKYTPDALEVIVEESNMLPGANPAKACKILDLLGAEAGLSESKQKIVDAEAVRECIRKMVLGTVLE